MKFPLKHRECSEMEQFTLLLEQATNQLPSAGIIRAPPVWFHDCSATEIAGPGGSTASGSALQCHVSSRKSGSLRGVPRERSAWHGRSSPGHGQASSAVPGALSWAALGSGRAAGPGREMLAPGALVELWAMPLFSLSPLLQTLETHHVAVI